MTETYINNCKIQGLQKKKENILRELIWKT